MLWFSVWAVLILATIAGAIWLGLRLWRSVKALMAQLEEASGLADRLDRQVAELEAAAAAAEQPAPGPAALADEAQRARWRATRAVNIRSRQSRREVRRTRALQRWRQIGIPG